MATIARLLLSLTAILVPSLTYAQSRTYGSWTVVMSKDKKDLIAATSVDSDKWLAYRCFGALGTCVHSITLAVECEDGKTYPVLVNASASALAMECTCSKNGDIYELIPDFKEFHDVLTRSSGYIGFALPMVSGQFKVVRFALDGMQDAMRLAERAAAKADSSQYQ